MYFKARTQGKRHPSKAQTKADEGLFEIEEECPAMEDLLRKEIDHFFVMTQLVDAVVLKGDETYRVMQELAKLTND